jgi:hypothetical protein
VQGRPSRLRTKGNSMTAKTFGVAVAGLLVLAACAAAPASGEVVSTEFNAAHYDTYLYCAAYTQVKGITTCSAWVQGQSYVPDAWKLKLRDSKHTGWRTVTREVYDACGIGAQYPACTASIEP